VWLAITSLAAVLLLAAPLAAEAQRAEEVPRVGYINPGFPSDPVQIRRLEAFRQGLRELGYAEGRNIALEPRWAEDKYDRYPAIAGDLVRLKVHVIVTIGGAVTKAAKQVTRTIPIVMSLVTDRGTCREVAPAFGISATGVCGGRRPHRV
jgi:putative tryptophan/tyrosine transport system substrate-binding protein